MEVEQKKTLFPDKKKVECFFICFRLFLSVFSSSAPVVRFPAKNLKNLKAYKL